MDEFKSSNRTEKGVYDALNRLTDITFPDPAENITLVYDNCAFGIGRLCRIEDESGVAEMDYDAYGNVAQFNQTVNGVNYSQSYQYDAGDRLIAVTLPSGRQVNYQRDSLGCIQTVTTQINGQSQAVLDAVRYNANGQILQQTFGNGLSETRLYDLQGRLIDQTLGASQTTGLNYDANGNILTRNTASIATAINTIRSTVCKRPQASRATPKAPSTTTCRKAIDSPPSTVSSSSMTTPAI